MKGLSIAGLILAIASLVLGWWLPYIALPCAIVGIVLSAKGRSAAKAAGAPAGMATAGLVLAIIGTVWSAIGLVYFIACAAAASAVEGAIGGDYEAALDAAEEIADMYS